MRLATALAAVLLLMTTLPSAQGRGGGRGGGGDMGGADFGGGVTRSPFDRLVEELDLDKKTQAPVVAAMLDRVEREAAALFQELVVRRQDLLNVETNRSSDPAPAAAHAATATKLVALEARVFGEIYAQLTPKQKQKAAKGFDSLEMLFKDSLSTPGVPAGAGRGGPGGPGRGMPPQGGGR